MLILGQFSLLFCIVYCSGNRLKINMTPYLENVYYLTYRDKIKNLVGYIFEKFFTTKKLWDELSVFRCALHLR